MSAPFSRSVVTTCTFFDPAKMGGFVTIRARQRMKTHWVLRPGGKLGENMRNRIWVTWNFYFRNLGMKFFTRIPLPFDSVFDPESAQICVKQGQEQSNCIRTVAFYSNLPFAHATWIWVQANLDSPYLNSEYLHWCARKGCIVSMQMSFRDGGL